MLFLFATHLQGLPRARLDEQECDSSARPGVPHLGASGLETQLGFGVDCAFYTRIIAL